LCKWFGISRQAFYKKVGTLKKKRKETEIIVQMVKQERKSHSRLGGKKVYKNLQRTIHANGLKCGRDKFLKILREEDLLIKTKRKYVQTTQSYHRFRKHPNLIKDLNITRSEQVWVSDITYIKTQEGFMYLFLITDAYSKQIMGYELSDNMKVINSIKALEMAIRNRKYPDRALIHHSDRGLQYCHPDYIELLEKNQIKVSMTTKHDPYENAVAERINGILKNEYLTEGYFLDLKDAQREVAQAIWMYNHKRPHYSCKFQTPSEAHHNEGFEIKKWPSKFSKLKQLSN
jgi:transposase InsO family protein